MWEALSFTLLTFLIQICQEVTQRKKIPTIFSFNLQILKELVGSAEKTEAL